MFGKKSHEDWLKPIETAGTNFVIVSFDAANARPEAASAIGIAAVTGSSIVAVSCDIGPKGTPWGEIWARAEPVLAGRSLVSHYVPFVLDVFEELAGENYDDSMWDKIYDTLELSQRAWPQLESHRLADVCAAQAIPFGNGDVAHRASACAQVFLKLLLRSKGKLREFEG